MSKNKDINILIETGDTSLSSGDFQRAIDAFSNVLKINDNDSAMHFKLGVSYYYFKNFESAITHLNKSLELNPNMKSSSPSMYNDLSSVLTHCYKHTLDHGRAIKYSNNIHLSKEIDRAGMHFQKKNIETNDVENFIGCWDIEDYNLIDSIVEFFENNTSLHRQGSTYGGINIEEKNSVDLCIQIHHLKQEPVKFIHKYLDYINLLLNDYIKNYDILSDFNLSMGTFNIQKYCKGGHFRNIHSERTDLRNMDRVFAWMTYLNDVDDGGATYFSHYDLRVKPKKGRTLIWPAEWTHAHCGEIVNSNEKYIITGWIDFTFPKK